MGKKILLADDSITIQKVIELTFSDEDFEVVTVGNGRLAIERLPEAQPDLVLCDIIMPEKDGYEVCEYIKKNPSLSHIPVLLLTGAFEPFDQERANRVGCDGFLAKPFEPQTLIAKVKDLLAKAASRPAAASAPAPAPAPAPTPAPAPAASVSSSATVAAPAFSMASPPPPPPAPATSAAAPPAYDRGTGFDASGEPELAPMEPLEPEESGAAPDAGVYGSEDDALGTVQSPPYRGDEGGPFAGKPPASLDELYDDEPYGAPPDLMPLTDDESTSVSGSAGEGAAVDEEPAPWAQPTVEVPLETRAQAGVEHAAQAANAAGGFEEVFDDESGMPPLREAAGPAAAAPVPPTVERGFGFARQEDVSNVPSAPSTPSPAAPPTVKDGFGWVRDADVPAAAAPGLPTETSFGDITPRDEAPVAAKSVTGEVPVPVDMVEKIAQRVVAQISEKVIREIAWEVIPDLAEALIRREIDRLKAELQQT